MSLLIYILNVVELYTKPKCYLCDAAKAELLAIKQEYPFSLIEIDITKSDELLEKYAEEIPVIVCNGEFISRYNVDSEKLVKMLKNNV